MIIKVFFWPIQNTNQSFQPIQNPDQHHHLPQQQQNFNQDYDQPNLDQQQKSYARQIQQQRIQNYILQSYEHYNQNRNNRNHMITPTQVLSQQPQKQRQIPCVKENSSTPSPTIYNDCLNLNIPSSNIHYGINSNDVNVSHLLCVKYPKDEKWKQILEKLKEENLECRVIEKGRFEGVCISFDMFYKRWENFYK
ncbi:20706_t:CDS:2 [Entrophospora sp. SA101]|nr:20706_t:CDS:2 [Entrophospora sp. SA101]